MIPERFLTKTTNTPSSCLRIANELMLANGEEAKDTNFVFSPYSIQLVLSLAANGAKRSTKEELLTFLEAENMDELNSRNKDLIDHYNFADGTVLSCISGVWVDQSLPLKPNFKRRAENIYKGKAESVDFQNETKREELIAYVNKWVEKSTNGLIKSILPDNSLTDETRLVLANALYFKGRWDYGFNKSLTKDYKFNLLDGSTVEVPFMSILSGAERLIATLEDFKILKLHYSGGRVSMYIILPNKQDGLWSLLEKVGSDPNFLEKYHKDLRTVRVRTFRVPKFKISYGFEAKEVLQNLGLNSLFSCEAELGDSVQGLEPGQLLKVAAVHHKSIIEVNEEETEAAAVTEMDDELSISDEPPVLPVDDFVADHPFIFMVRDYWTGVVFFMGHVVNPLLD
ncbi:Serpin-zx [Thalictrum thalictroides]|uniref:Serpin-zx n=1 Tax=Thalictrum thalictroides TaxID=46969 RepID=A0A7J6WC37_THATH|nr:Serpin-zx [Thalictrum thalictroides]